MWLVVEVFVLTCFWVGVYYILLVFIAGFALRWVCGLGGFGHFEFLCFDLLVF